MLQIEGEAEAEAGLPVLEVGGGEQGGGTGGALPDVGGWPVQQGRHRGSPGVGRRPPEERGWAEMAAVGPQPRGRLPASRENLAVTADHLWGPCHWARWGGPTGESPDP